MIAGKVKFPQSGSEISQKVEGLHKDLIHGIKSKVLLFKEIYRVGFQGAKLVSVLMFKFQ